MFHSEQDILRILSIFKPDIQSCTSRFSVSHFQKVLSVTIGLRLHGVSIKRDHRATERRNQWVVGGDTICNEMRLPSMPSATSRCALAPIY